MRIVHGYGTGQLRRAIAGFLKEHPLVAHFEDAPAEPGRRRRDGRRAEGLAGSPSTWPLFPQQFIDDLKHHADIVVVIRTTCRCKKTGATYKGLCPFHGEKTPSFHVNRDKGFFHCFGCGVGGDVFKFLELHEKVGFADAVKQLAQRFGMTLPELEQSDEQRAGAAERETLLKIHESAAAWFREQLAIAGGRPGPGADRIPRRQRRDRRDARPGLRAAGARRAEDARCSTRASRSRCSSGPACWSSAMTEP